MYNLNRRVTIRRWSHSVDQYSGVQTQQVAFWSKWMAAQNRSGTIDSTEQQITWTYDNVFVLRYEKSRPTKSNDTIDYEGYRYIIRSISIKEEGRKDWEIIFVSRTDENIGNISPTNTDNVKPYYYPPVGGEDEFEVPGLKGKTIIAAFKDGLEHTVIVIGDSSASGQKVGKWVEYTKATGTFKWQMPFGPDEQDALILYI